ncbi:hypothetical protein V5P93_002349 [Actinokineospora auranticolor]|uniref:RAMA domain-containing protein n=1 Tax=Actinokineospora auranticolor TaxID=155976 RepID=A0A2S6GDU6_9PSEU|nr:hypothetical protein [Actinokineospora auranticolor]PPK63380.1 hypothetical protein CLV40_12993 [Actinokineospora auranticolor]
MNTAVHDALPPEAVSLIPASPHPMPIRAPAGAWGLVVIAVRTTHSAGAPVRLIGDGPPPDPAHTDIADLMAGVWLPSPPPAALCTGDVVVRLHAPDNGDPALADVEILAAMQGQWHSVGTSTSVDARWPHTIALSALLHMRWLADAAFSDAQWVTLTSSSIPALLTRKFGLDRESAGRAPRRVPDALADLVTARLLEVGERLVWNGHTVTVGEHGVVHPGPDALTASTVTAHANHVSKCTVNGWHLWRRASDSRLLADLRAELTTR